MTILENGSVKGFTKITSKGIQYNNVSELENLNSKEKLDYYKNHFSHLNNLEISELKFVNDKGTISFEEQFNLGFPFQQHEANFNNHKIIVDNLA